MDATPGSDDAHTWFDADRDGDLLRPGAEPAPRRSPTPLATTPWRAPAVSPVPALDQTFVRAIPVVAEARRGKKAREPVRFEPSALSPADEAEWLAVATERRRAREGAAPRRADPQSFLVLAAAGFAGALFAVTSTMCAAAAGLAALYVWTT